jgi:hypothetical protein
MGATALSFGDPKPRIQLFCLTRFGVWRPLIAKTPLALTGRFPDFAEEASSASHWTELCSKVLVE